MIREVIGGQGWSGGGAVAGVKHGWGWRGVSACRRRRRRKGEEEERKKKRKKRNEKRIKEKGKEIKKKENWANFFYFLVGRVFLSELLSGL